MVEKRLTTEDAEEARLRSIIEIAFAFTSMIRVFKKGSSEEIIKLLTEKFSQLKDVRDENAYKKLHNEFCVQFMEIIRTSHDSNEASYGQAAKVFDIAVKVYVYYCGYPNQNYSRLVPMLYGAIDTPILKHLKSEHKDMEISAMTIYEIDEKLYLILQKLIKEEIQKNKYDYNIAPVQYDDIMWRRLKEEGERKKREKGRR